jgi:hypothetical protein
MIGRTLWIGISSETLIFPGGSDRLRGTLGCWFSAGTRLSKLSVPKISPLARSRKE